ncbi:MAG TPA: UMP kinase [Verrucomicrobiae bacterium]|nr:UMP kinase [Verrucomicrobiae bacterium]
MRPKRVLLKASGEALNGKEKKFPWDDQVIETIAHEIAAANGKGVEIAVVMGGGNIFRGANGKMDRVRGDQIGMLATLQNGIALADVLISHELEVRLTTAVEINEVAEKYLVHKARHHLEAGRIVILAGGTGHGFCTTDYAAALRASELECDLLAMAKNVNGVYDSDPKANPNARLLTQASYERCLREDLKVMDTEAFARCRDGNIPIRVFSLLEKGNIEAALTGAPIGTLVSSLPDPDWMPPARTTAHA